MVSQGSRPTRIAVDPVARRPFKAPAEEYNHIKVAQQCKKLADRGVKVNLGAHGQREGLGAHWELWMLEQGGMTPHESLRAADLLEPGARVFAMTSLPSLSVRRMGSVTALMML